MKYYFVCNNKGVTDICPKCGENCGFNSVGETGGSSGNRYELLECKECGYTLRELDQNDRRCPYCGDNCFYAMITTTNANYQPYRPSSSSYSNAGSTVYAGRGSKKGLAIAGLILGIIAFCAPAGAGIVLGILGIILAACAGQSGIKIAALVVSILATVVDVIFLFAFATIGTSSPIH
jgi:hypothetical protein